MALLWPEFLALLGLIPILIGLYIWILRRRRRFAVRYSSLSLVRDAMPKHSWLRRHLPFILFLIALSSLMLALTRPVAIVTVPTTDTTVILSIDASRSMCSTDIPPNRLEAAKSAALDFIQSQKSNTKIGIVVFAGFAAITQPPTTDQEMLQDAIQSIDVGRRTAIGSGIIKSIDAIAEINKNIPPSDSGTTASVIPTPVPKGAYAPAIIILLTDGVSNVGPLPMDAAQQAADRGIRVYTIGFGTDANESIPNCGRGSQGGGNAFGNGGGNPFGGGGNLGGFRRGIDEETLKQVADLTGGAYYPAASANELQKVFQNLPIYLITQHETMEISVAFTALGVFLAALAILLSFAWHPLT
jgi:Ca-activated chloride channel family protein